MAFSVNAAAQKDSSGIYKTAEGFQDRKLSYAVNYKKEKYAVHSIYDYVLFNDSIIIIKVNDYGTCYTLRKSDTYGYRSIKGEEFRFIDDKVYKILNTGEPVTVICLSASISFTKRSGQISANIFF